MSETNLDAACNFATALSIIDIPNVLLKFFATATPCRFVHIIMITSGVSLSTLKIISSNMLGFMDAKSLLTVPPRLWPVGHRAVCVLWFL